MCMSQLPERNNLMAKLWLRLHASFQTNVDRIIMAKGCVLGKNSIVERYFIWKQSSIISHVEECIHCMLGASLPELSVTQMDFRVRYTQTFLMRTILLLRGTIPCLCSPPCWEYPLKEAWIIPPSELPSSHLPNKYKRWSEFRVIPDTAQQHAALHRNPFHRSHNLGHYRNTHSEQSLRENLLLTRSVRGTGRQHPQLGYFI